jgi:phenylpropionate dioxygenase-like ring-hydroxylating dioxygenase large terminal subunit
MSFLRNAWYVAAWAEEVDDRPLGRRVLNEPIVLYRDTRGSVIALSGRCPHRFAPMHAGKVLGDNIRCPYHGLQFNGEGKCVHNPVGNGATPAAASLRRYPLLERYNACWVWMGEEDRADPDTIPNYNFLDDEKYVCVRGYLHSHANYELLTDNILDLSHIDFLHKDTLGSDATARADVVVKRVGNTIHCNRWMPNDVQGPLLNWLFDRPTEKVDAWMEVQWDAPGLLLLAFGATNVGSPRENGAEVPNVHFMTPETETSTHYFWASGRKFRTKDEEFSAALYQGLNSAFTQEDKPIIEAQQELMGAADFWSLRPVLLSSDSGGVQARRILAKMIEMDGNK